MKDIQQLIKKNSQEGRYEDIFPKTFIDAISDKESGVTLADILAMFNMLFLSYNGSRSQTRLQVPSSFRREGLWVTYVLYDKTVVTEWYSAEAIDDTSWEANSNWRDGSNSLVGDISISSDGYWVINGEITNIKAQGEAGITPILRVGSNNHLQVSYTNGSTYVDVSPNPVFTQFRVSNNKLEQSVDLGLTWTVASDYIAAWFRFTGTAGGSQVDNVGKIQISRDNGVTWSDLSGEFTNSLYIKGYVATVSALPSTAVQGDIYGVGPTYDPSDTEHTNPIYQLYVKDSTGWVNNGKFTSITAGVVQVTGLSETEVMSQKAVTLLNREVGKYGLDIAKGTWEIGDIISSSGIPISTATTLRTPDFIMCFPSQKFKISIDTNPTYTPLGFFYTYDINKKFIGIIPAVGDITIQDNAYFLKVVLSSQYGTTYNEDVSILRVGGYQEMVEGYSVQAASNLKDLEDYTLGNIYDSQWEIGDIDSTTGKPAIGNVLRTTDFFKCFAGVKLYFQTPVSLATLGYIYYYDSSFGFLNYDTISITRTVTPPSRASYAKVVLSSSYGTTYNNNVSIYQEGGVGITTASLENYKNFTDLIIKNKPNIEWEIGDISSSTGVPVTGATTLRTKNFIQVYPSLRLQFSSYRKYSSFGYIYLYDTNQNYIPNNIIPITLVNRDFIIPDGVYFAKVVLASSYGTTFNNDLTIYSYLPTPRSMYRYIVAKDGSGDYTSLTAAVSNSSTGDIIFVKKGVYDNEEVEAYGKEISIIGEDRDATIIQGAGGYANPPIEMCAGLLRNLTFNAYGTVPSTGGRYAYALHADNDYLANRTFTCENCTFITESGFGAVGAGLRGGCTMTFRDCEFVGKKLSFFMNETVTTRNQPTGIQYLNIIDCVFKCIGDGTYNSTLAKSIMAEFEGYKSVDSTVYCTFINNVFTHKNAAPILYFLHAGGDYPDTSTQEGNIILNSSGEKMINWFITRESTGNTCTALNRVLPSTINNLS